MNGNTSKDEMGKSNPQKEDRSYLHVEFASIGSADPNISISNVTPNQIMAAVGYLETYAKTFYSQQIAKSLQKQVEQQLSVPKPEIEIAK